MEAGSPEKNDVLKDWSLCKMWLSGVNILSMQVPSISLYGPSTIQNGLNCDWSMEEEHDCHEFISA